jgi:hypothetical protein
MKTGTDTQGVRNRRRLWPNVYSRKNSGGTKRWVVDLAEVNGKRERHLYKTKEEAEPFAEQCRIKRQNEGLLAFRELTGDVRADAANANQLLNGSGVSLTQAAKYYVDHVLRFQNAPLIKDIVDRMVKEADANNRRDRTVRDLRHRLRTFAIDFGEQKLSDIDLEEL